MLSRSNSISAIVADEYPLLIAGIVSALRESKDFNVIGQTGSGPEALQMLTTLKPNVAVISLSMPEMNGILIAQQATAANCATGIAVFSAQEHQIYVERSLSAGARGYLLKRSPATNLVHALRAIDAGGLYLDPAVAGRHFSPSTRGEPGSHRPSAANALSHREEEVLRLVAYGYSSKEVGARLGLSAKSVETYKARSTEKLGITCRSQLTKYALLKGWLDAHAL